MVASTIGAITGIGGWIIIKPLIDAFGILPVSSASFLSGLTVLCMSTVSLIRSRDTGAQIDTRRTTFLGLGAAFGGVAGKLLFQLIKTQFPTEAAVGITQAAVLAALTVLVFVYMICQKRIQTHNIQNRLVCAVTGLILGLLSAFLGIGGGPINLVALYFLFSMDTKTAALNSIYVILLSQIASLLLTIGTGTIPEVSIWHLLFMCLGGGGGGLIGNALVKRMDAKGMNQVFLALLVVIVLICCYNIWRMAL